MTSILCLVIFFSARMSHEETMPQFTNSLDTNVRTKHKGQQILNLILCTFPAKTLYFEAGLFLKIFKQRFYQPNSTHILTSTAINSSKINIFDK